MADILLRVQAASVLMVGETPNFLREGGHARFYVENNFIRIEIDAAGADRAGLKIDSKLLASRGAELCASRLCEGAEPHSGRTGRRAPTASNPSKVA